ncbi:MAG: ATP-binding protein [Saprospiraceae bacterium]|nr:ATP-binding protein [Saprospiraceae bacterium]
MLNQIVGGIIQAQVVRLILKTNFQIFNGHKSLFQQLFLNLFSNSIKYSKTNEPLIINLRNELSQDSYCKISISDNGMGIPLVINLEF